MKKLLLLVGITTTLCTINANAMDLTPYVGAKLRYSMMDNSVDFDGIKLDIDDEVFGGSVSTGVAYKIWGNAVRAELEYNKNTDAKKTHYDAIDLKVKTQSLMLNGYFDINTNTKFTPYIGAGIGYTKLEGEVEVLGTKESEDKNTFSWQLGVGVGYSINEHISIDLGYRYVDYGDWTRDNVKLESDANEIYISARYMF